MSEYIPIQHPTETNKILSSIINFIVEILELQLYSFTKFHSKSLYFQTFNFEVF